MRILAAIHPPETTRAILECLALPSRAPPIEPARRDELEQEMLPSLRVEDDFGAWPSRFRLSHAPGPTAAASVLVHAGAAALATPLARLEAAPFESPASWWLRGSP